MRLECDPEVARAISEYGPRETYRRFCEQLDREIRSPVLDNGRNLAARRTVLHTTLVAHWLAAQQQEFGYDRPFGLVAIGGTGRGEMTPCSDTDFALLFEESTEHNPFLDRLLAQTIHGKQFVESYGFPIWPQPYNLEHLPALAGIQLNAFLDMSAVYDPHDLARRFRERIRATFDPFEHFLHVSSSWRGVCCSRAEAACERLDQFDIKKEGLRAFLAGVWTLGGPPFCHSWEVYAGLDDQRDLEAYYFLLRIRACIHLRRGTHLPAKMDGSHAEDLLRFEDFESFGELLGEGAGERERFEFANQVRARLLAARRRVDRFARGVIARELQQGHRTSPGSGIIHSVAGLRREATAHHATLRDRSSSALSLVLASQRYGVAIDPAELETTFRNAGDWLLLVPELSALFYETRGSLADSLEFLAQVDGALERLFPGYSRFEASLDERVLEERVALRSAWVREKLRALDACLRIGWKRQAREKARWDPHKATLADMVIVEAALLDSDHLAAVKLALVTKRLPRTADDDLAREDPNLELHERFASGFANLALRDYFPPYVTQGGFSESTGRIAEFLVAQRRALKRFSQHGRNDDAVVSELVNLCGDAQLLRALFVFTCADRLMGMPSSDLDPDASQPEAAERHRRAWWLHENNAVRWFNTRELYVKALARFVPGVAPDAHQALSAAGYGARESEVLEDFGRDFFSGQYVRHTNHFASHLLRLVDAPDVGPKVQFVRDGDALLLGVAARDFRGLAACIAGALLRQNVSLSQAHLFSANRYHLALDFFHLAADQAIPRDLSDAVCEAVRHQRHIAPEDAATLPPLDGRSTLDGAASGGCCLRHETPYNSPGLLYALTYKVYQELGGAIHALCAYTSRGSAYVTIHLSLPHDRSFADAQRIVAQW